MWTIQAAVLDTHSLLKVTNLGPRKQYVTLLVTIYVTLGKVVILWSAHILSE